MAGEKLRRTAHQPTLHQRGALGVSQGPPATELGRTAALSPAVDTEKAGARRLGNPQRRRDPTPWWSCLATLDHPWRREPPSPSTAAQIPPTTTRPDAAASRSRLCNLRKWANLRWPPRRRGPRPRRGWTKTLAPADIEMRGEALTTCEEHQGRFSPCSAIPVATRPRPAPSTSCRTSSPGAATHARHSVPQRGGAPVCAWGHRAVGIDELSVLSEQQVDERSHGAFSFDPRIDEQSSRRLICEGWRCGTKRHARAAWRIAACTTRSRAGNRLQGC